uniref:Uncharacterized protein n=1 Tax=Cannabis sativa TaxID=3483 RepID=A0A803PUS3_CANSA
MLDYALYELELHGQQFTWERCRGTSRWVEVRLDRAFANSIWMSKFYSAKLFNLNFGHSDHWPIFLDLVLQTRGRRNKTSRFKNVWLKEEMCGLIVQDTWILLQGPSINVKVATCRHRLMDWRGEITGSFKARIAATQVAIKKLQDRRDEVSYQ